MTRRRKILLVACGVTVLALVAAAVTLPFLIDAERFRPLLERMASSRIGRPVTLGHLHLATIPRIAVTADGLTVAGATPAEPPLLEASRVSVAAELSPLLHGRLEVDGLTLEKATVRLARDAAGKWNVASLLAASPANAQAGAVSLDELVMRDGHVLVADAAVEAGRRVDTEVTGLDVRLRGLTSSSRPVRVQARLTLPGSGGAHVSFDGTAGPGRAVDGSLQTTGLVLDTLAPYMRAATGRSVSGKVSIDGSGSFAATGACAFKGKVEAVGFRAAPDGSRSAPADLRADVDVHRDATGALEAKRAELATGKSTITVHGSMGGATDAGAMSLAVDSSVLSPPDLTALAGAFGLPAPSGLGTRVLRASGRARIVRGAGPAGGIREIDLDGIRLSGGSLEIRRERDGSLVLPGVGTSSGSGPGPRVAARDMRLDDVAVRYTDASSPGPPQQLDVSALSLRVGSMAPSSPADVTLQAKLLGGTVSAEGHAGPAGGAVLPFDLDVRTKDLDVAALAPWIGVTASGSTASGRAGGETRLVRQPDGTLQAKGSLTVQAARVQPPAPATPLGPLDVTLEHDVVIGDGGKSLTLRSAAVRLPHGVVIPLTGSLRFPAGAPMQGEIGTTSPVRLAPADAALLAGLAGHPLPVTVESAQPLEIEARWARGAGDAEMAGRLRVTQATVRHRLLPAPLQVASSDVTVSGDRLTIEHVAVKLEQSDLSGRFSCEDFRNPRVGFELASRAADLDEIFAFARAAGQVEDPGAPAPGGDVLARTTASGKLSVAAARWGGLKMSDLASTIGMRGRVITADPAALALYGGTASGRVSVDLSGAVPTHSATATLANVDVGALLADGLGYHDLRGTGTVHLDLAGRIEGGLPGIMQAVTGQGDLALEHGEFHGLNVLAVLGKAGVFGERTLASLGKRLAAQGTPFDSMTGRWSVGSGTLRLTGVQATAPDADVAMEGKVDLGSLRLDLDVRVLFSEAVSQAMAAEGSRAAQVFWDESRHRVLLPLKLTGTVSNPSAGIDWGNALGRLAGRQVNGALGGLLGGGTSSGRTPSAPDQRTPGSGLEPPSGATSPPPSQAPEQAKTGSSGLAATIDSARFGGNALAPDLRVRATLSGRDLDHGSFVVTDDHGRVIARTEPAWTAEIAAGRAAVAPGSDLRVSVSANVSAEKLLGVSHVTVEITPLSASGAAGPKASTAVTRKALF